MDIDETRRDDLALGVERGDSLAIREFADLGDTVA
jgi:hypothetical protein